MQSECKTVGSKQNSSKKVKVMNEYKPYWACIDWSTAIILFIVSQIRLFEYRRDFFYLFYLIYSCFKVVKKNFDKTRKCKSCAGHLVNGDKHLCCTECRAPVSEWTIRRSSRRLSMKIMVGMYRSRFHTIDYSRISQENVQYLIFSSFYIK